MCTYDYTNTYVYAMALKKMLLWIIAAAIILVLSWVFQPNKAAAQTINTLGENTLNGALTGTLLGGATMALTNDTDFYPLQVGLGLGTLYGLGVGAYDLLKTGGNPTVVSGMFYWIPFMELQRVRLLQLPSCLWLMNRLSKDFNTAQELVLSLVLALVCSTLLYWLIDLLP
jgi:hypothetical protein